jgi:hypothetical protein
VHTHEIHIAGGREAVSEIRRQLFVFPEVLEVLAGSRADSLIVVFSTRPRPAEWNSHLRNAGYQPLRRPARSSDPASRRGLAAVQGSGERPAERSAAAGRRTRARRGRVTRASRHVSP